MLPFANGMHLKSLELSGFKSFGKKEKLGFNVPISAIVGPNGSGKSNIAEAFRFVLGEQSIKSMRGKKGEDLIWGGGKSTPRANRASVKVVFDNANRLFDLDFDEVSIERSVHRDGVNQYAINGSQVRLRDVVELLAAANIGSSGHHIISQGEADRILNTSPKERREMIEDALGLKVYHYKLAESEKKLQKTKENIAQVEALRKEIAPHLRFLKRQVEKVEKTEKLREELQHLYREYLKRESVYLSWWETYIEDAKKAPTEELANLEIELNAAKATLEREHKNDEKSKEVIDIESKLRRVREKRDVLTRDLGGLEGEIRAEERRSAHGETTEKGEQTVPLSAVKGVLLKVESEAQESSALTDVSELKRVIQALRNIVRAFVSEQEQTHNTTQLRAESRVELERLKREREEKVEALATLSREETELEETYKRLKEEIDSVRDKSREAERNMFSVMTKQNELRAKLQELTAKENELKYTRDRFNQELEEGAVLVGRSVLSYEGYQVVGESGEELSAETVAQEGRHIQEKRGREIERIKIRLEELGSGGGEDILKEYNEVSERDAFLEREIEDLHTSASSLAEVMSELEDKLHTQFKEGVARINKEFENFFSLMFGGGSAALKLVKSARRKSVSEEFEDVQEEEEAEEGIDIAVSLPRKRIKGLVMLSGGERALTSIALLFAMSQVNPPPFLILDETDAALDEANSRRYGDMVENLSKYSQLIVITHNRETMSRAHVLYGVTMGSEGLSKLLSIKFDEAVQVAK